MSILPTTTSRGRLTVLGAVLVLAASGVVAANLAGAASGISALDYAQCDNGAPGTTNSLGCPAGAWINGILNANNSQYKEDDVTPQRLTVTFPDKGTGDHLHSITLRYLDRKAGIHAYDYLAAANATQTSALTDRCAGIPASYCPAGTQAGGAPSQASVVPAYTADTTTVLPDSNKTTGLAKDHMANLSADQLKLSIYGATFTSGNQSGFSSTNPPAISTPTHDNACLGCGDDYATVVLSFKTTGNGNHNVQLLFGGHLAAGENADGWGSNLGAGSVSGGPYHIKWDAADGVSVGNRDNQIMSSAIAKVTPQGSTLSTTPSKTSEDLGSTNLSAVTDTAELTPDSGHAPSGTMTFTLYGPLTAPDYNDCTNPDNTVDPVVIGNIVAGPDTGHALALKSGTTNTYTATSNTVDMSGFAPGVYQWVAAYVHGTDQYNTDVAGDCGDSTERVTINRADAVGSSTQTITDTVTVSGYGTPSGHVNWYAYDTSDCSNTPVFSDEWVSDADSGSQNNLLDATTSTATSEGFTPDPADGGTPYYWKVTYSGDDNNNPGTVEPCGDQGVTVQNAPAGP